MIGPPPIPTLFPYTTLFRSNTTDTQTAVATGVFGPYLQQAPTNPVNGQSAIGAAAATTVGWVYTTSAGQYPDSAGLTTGNGPLPYSVLEHIATQIGPDGFSV